MATHVVVIGGGVARASAAYWLARNEVDVTLVDAEHEGQATAAGAGIISSAGVRHDDEWRRFFQDATAYHRQLVADSAPLSEKEIGYRVVDGAHRISPESLIEIPHLSARRLV